MKIPKLTIEQLLEAGVHLGHKTLRWNPKMKQYIFGKRDTIHIIDLTQTLELTNKQLTNITFKFNNIEELKKIKNLNVKDGKTYVNILLDKDNKIHKFQLKDKRKVNNQLLNSLNLLENVVID